MPIYEYLCDACDSPFERIQSIRDAAIPDCPGCGASSVRRLISSTSFQLKGSGWYATDYKSARPAVGGKREGGANASASKGDGGGCGQAA